MDNTTFITIILTTLFLLGIIICFIMKHNKEMKQIKKPSPLSGGEIFYHTSDESLPISKDYFFVSSNHKDDNSKTSSQTTQPTSYDNSTDDGFLTSMLIAEVTDSSLIGAMVGGNPLGATIGDLLNDSDSYQSSHDSFDDTGSSGF